MPITDVFDVLAEYNYSIGSVTDTVVDTVESFPLTYQRTAFYSHTTTVVPSHDDKCYECVWLPMCGGGCPQLRLFGKPECPAYRDDPEAFVLAMHARIPHK